MKVVKEGLRTTSYLKMSRQSRLGLFLLATLIVNVLGDAVSQDTTEPEDSEEPKGPAPSPELVEGCEKWRIKQLRQFLDERGLECRGCAEKADWVELVKSSWDKPVLSEEEMKAKQAEAEAKKTKPAGRGAHTSGGSAASSSDDNSSDSAAGDMDYDEIMKMFGKKNKEQEELMEKLRAAGINVDNLNFGGMDFSKFAGMGGDKKKPKEAKADEVEL